MVGDAVKKVECKTCRSHHLYRRPKTERDAAQARMVKRAEDRKAAVGSGGGGTQGQRAARADKAEREQVSAWEHAIAGKPTTAFTAYRISLTFGQGDLIRHSKFG